MITKGYGAYRNTFQPGVYDYIKYHIPTYVGSGLSGMPYVASDIDGIFGGSAETYTRDLQ